jgi:hypothetical protein
MEERKKRKAAMKELWSKKHGITHVEQEEHSRF